MGATANAWLTPDTEAAPVFVCRLIRIPLELLPHVSGAIGELTEASNWEAFGDMTPDAAASLALDMYLEFLSDPTGCELPDDGITDELIEYVGKEVAWLLISSLL